MWFDELFKNFKVSELYDTSIKVKDFNALGCLINSPKTTMAIPLVGLSIEDNVELIAKTASLGPDFRCKPLLSTSNGRGSGKTRAFEELRRRLFVEPGCFPMCITFSNEWGMNDDDESRIEEFKRIGFHEVDEVCQLTPCYSCVSS